MQRDDRVKPSSAPLRYPLFLAASILILDQATKLAVRIHLPPGKIIEVVPGFFHILFAKNTGVAFSFLSRIDPKVINPLLIVVNILVLALLLFILARHAKSYLTWSSYGLIIGGALGNLFDRISLGYVVDFIDFFLGTHHWPVFNVADSAITIGIILLIADLLYFGKEKK